MKKTVFVFGLISGLIICSMMAYSAAACCKNPEMKGNEVLGYVTMIVAFAFIFIGIKHFRDKYQGGVISFASAFRVGFFIALVASVMYVTVWLIEYYLFIPEFMDKYSEHVLFRAKSGGASATELAEKTKEMADFKEMYKNPLFVVLITLTEVLPVGLVGALISALILKRKKTAPETSLSI
jgi:MFS family permease